MKRALMTAAIALSTTAGSAFAQTHWDLPLTWAPENYMVQRAADFADAVKEATAGEVLITLHPGGSLGYKGPEMLSAVRDGLVPIGDVFLNQQVGDEPLLGIQSLPYLMESFEEMIEFQAYFRPLLDEIAARNNQKVIYTIPSPQQQIFTKVEVSTFADFSGIKIRSYDAASTKIFEAAGMTPVQLPWGEVIPSLATGAIDAVATSAPFAVDGSFWEFLKYGYPTRQSWNLNAVTVNLDAWAELSEEHRKAIEELGAKLEPTFWQSAQDTDAAQMKILAEKGMVNGEISDEIRQQLRETTAPLRAAELETLGETAAKLVEAFENR